jgi:hypothetical protein
MMVVVVLAAGKTKLAVATTSNDYFALLSSASTGTREKSRLLRFLLHLFCQKVLANALKLAADFQDKKARRGRVRILGSILRRLEKSRRAFYTSVINNRGKKGNKPFSRSC